MVRHTEEVLPADRRYVHPIFPSLAPALFEYGSNVRDVANISLATNGNYSWQVNVPNEKIAQEPKFVFRFSQHTNPEVFNFDLPKMPSRGFILLRKEKKEEEEVSSSTTMTTTTTSVSSQTSTAGLGPSSSPPVKETEADEKPKAAIIAACVLAVLLGIALVLGVALFFLRRARRRREDEEKPRGIYSKKGDGDSVHMYVYPTQELPAPPQELIGDGTGQSRELNGSTPRDWH